MSNEQDLRQPVTCEAGRRWVDKVEFEVLGNLRTDFTMLTYTNLPPKSTRSGDSLPEVPTSGS
jgi:hypothetical protein